MISISQNICNLNYPRYIYIAIDDYQTSARNFLSIAAKSIMSPNIIARINIQSVLEKSFSKFSRTVQNISHDHLLFVLFSS